MIGFNSALLGVRRVPTTGMAPGVWVPNEQVLAKRAGIWPQVITDPTAGLSPVLWYDFADESTVTTSSGQITQITDKGSANRTLTKSATGPTYATTINSKKVSDWGTSTHSNYLRNTSSTSFTVAEVYVIADTSDTTSFSGFPGLITNLTNVNILLTGAGTGFEYGNAGNLNRVYLNGGTTDQFNDIFPEIESPCLLRANRSDLTAITTTNGFQLGMDRDNADRGWRGLIAEVICFSSVLNSTDRDSLQSWLASKWGIALV